MPDDIQWTFKGRALILKANLDQLERRDDDGFSRAGKTSGEDGERLSVFRLTIRGEDGAPPSCGSFSHGCYDWVSRWSSPFAATV